MHWDTKTSQRDRAAPLNVMTQLQQHHDTIHVEHCISACQTVAYAYRFTTRVCVQWIDFFILEYIAVFCKCFCIYHQNSGWNFLSNFWGTGGYGLVTLYGSAPGVNLWIRMTYRYLLTYLFMFIYIRTEPDS